MCGEKYATLPISGQCGPMKLMSLEEAQARSLSPNHPVHKERQRENSLPDTSTATLYHTVIDLSDSKYDRFDFRLSRLTFTSGLLNNPPPIFQEKVFREIKEMEIHLQPGKICGFQGKTEPERQRVHKSTGDNR